MKLFLQDMKNLARMLLQEKFANLACKKIILQFFWQDSCKIFYILQEKLHFSARLARFSARSCKSCKKNTCKIWIFLARRFLLGFFRTTQYLTWGLNQHFLDHRPTPKHCCCCCCCRFRCCCCCCCCRCCCCWCYRLSTGT